MMLSCSSGTSSSNNSYASTDEDSVIRPSAEDIKKAKESLKFLSDMENKQLAGTQLDVMTTLVSADFDGTNLVYTCVIDEDYATIETLRNTQKEVMEKNIRNTLENDPRIESTKENLILIGGKIIYNYVGDTSNKVLTITIGF